MKKLLCGCISASIFLALTATAQTPTPTATAPAQSQNSDGKSKFELPKLRYILTVTDSTKDIYKSKVKSYLLPRKTDENFGGMFDLRTGIFKLSADLLYSTNSGVDELTGNEFLRENRQATLLTEISALDQITSRKNGKAITLTVATDSQGKLRITHDNQKKTKADVIGHWLISSPAGSKEKITPALCLEQEMPTEDNRASKNYRYGTKFDWQFRASEHFGCREWAHQLYDEKRPYIDVTAYSLPDTDGVIGKFIGWARTGDKKPVIGKQSSVWLCLHDCPDNEKPGVIPDIKVWAAKRGWSVPLPPTKAPTFPDLPAESGSYPR